MAMLLPHTAASMAVESLHAYQQEAGCGVSLRSYHLSLSISPLLGAELVELLTGSLQQPEASKVPAVDDEHRNEKADNDQHYHVFKVMKSCVHTLPSC